MAGLQMQQTQEIALAEQYQARAEAAQAMMLAQMETGESIFMFGGTPREEWSPKQQAIDSLVTSWAWTQFDNHFYQYQAGFLDDDAWAGMRRRTSTLPEALVRGPCGSARGRLHRTRRVGWTADPGRAGLANNGGQSAQLAGSRIAVEFQRPASSSLGSESRAR
jgi:hypothetical protein